MPENEQLEDVLRRLLAVVSKEEQLNTGVAGGDFSLPDDPSQIQKLNENLQKIFDPNNEGSFTKRVNELIVKFAEYKSASENNAKTITESNNKALADGFQTLNQSVEELNKNLETERKARIEKELKEQENQKKEISERIINKAVEDALAKYDTEIKTSKGSDASELRGRLDAMSVFDKDFEEVLKAAEAATKAQEEYFRKNIGKTAAQVELEERVAREERAKELKKEITEKADIQKQIKEVIERELKITSVNSPIAAAAQANENTNKELIGSTYPLKKLPEYAPSPQEVARDEERQKMALFKVNIVDIDQKAYDKLKELFEELNLGMASAAGSSGSSIDLYSGPGSRTNRPNAPKPNPPSRVPDPPKPPKPPTGGKPPRATRRPTGWEAAKSMKPPSYITRAGVAGAVVSGAYEGVDRYQQTGSAAEAVTVGASTTGGALAGAAAGIKGGALLGALAGPGAPIAVPILATIGGIIGGAIGAWGGKKVAETAIDAFAENGETSAEANKETSAPRIAPGTTNEDANETASVNNSENQIQENKELEAFNRGLVQGQNTFVNNTITETITENTINTSEALDKMALAAERINESMQRLETQMQENLKNNTASESSNNTTVMQGGNKIDLHITPPDIQQNRLESIEKLSGNR